MNRKTMYQKIIIILMGITTTLLACSCRGKEASREIERPELLQLLRGRWQQEEGTCFLKLSANKSLPIRELIFKLHEVEVKASKSSKYGYENSEITTMYKVTSQQDDLLHIWIEISPLGSTEKEYMHLFVTELTKDRLHLYQITPTGEKHSSLFRRV